MIEPIHERTPMTVLCCEVSALTLPPGPRGEELERRLSTDAGFFREIIQKAGGRLVNDHTNHIEALFVHSHKALQAAIKMQELILGQNSTLGKSSIRLKYRVGLDLGEVVVLDGRAQGPAADGARQLQQIGAPGKICFSEAVHQHTLEHVDLERMSGGLQLVGNRTVGTWLGRVPTDPDPLDLAVLRRRSAKPIKKTVVEKFRLIQWTPKAIGIAAVIVALFSFGVLRSFSWVNDFRRENADNLARSIRNSNALNPDETGFAITASIPILPGVTFRLFPRRGPGFHGHAYEPTEDLNPTVEPEDDEIDLTPPSEPTVVPTTTPDQEPTPETSPTPDRTESGGTAEV